MVVSPWEFLGYSRTKSTMENATLLNFYRKESVNFVNSESNLWKYKELKLWHWKTIEIVSDIRICSKCQIEWEQCLNMFQYALHGYDEMKQVFRPEIIKNTSTLLLCDKVGQKGGISIWWHKEWNRLCELLMDHINCYGNLWNLIFQEYESEFTINDSAKWKRSNLGK